MADSDDEYPSDKKKPRDKFERERSDCDERSRVWSDQLQAQNAGWNKSRVSNRNNDNRYIGVGVGHMTRRITDNRERSPSNKKFRGDFDDRVVVHSTYNHLEHAQFYSPKVNHDNQQRIASYINKPIFKSVSSADDIGPMSFRKFLSTLDDNIDEADALKKYMEYKSDLCQTKIEKFFDVHKDEEWFRLKYHPDESRKRLIELTVHMRYRLQLFNELMASKFMGKVSLDIDRSRELSHLMDSLILKLERESEEPLEALLRKQRITADVKNGHSLGRDKETDEAGLQASSRGHHSIVLANLPIDTTKANLLEILAKLPGFIRVSLTDPYYTDEGHLRRRAFATFKTHKDVMDVYWKLGRTEIGNCKIEAAINKEISKRIRHVDGLTLHQSVVMNDLKNAVVLILRFDDLRKTWDTDTLQDGKQADSICRNSSQENMQCEPMDADLSEGDLNKSEDQSSFEEQSTKSQEQPVIASLESGKATTNSCNDGWIIPTGIAAELDHKVVRTKNPILRNIGIYLVEETSAEEDELLGFGAYIENEQIESAGSESDDKDVKSEKKLSDFEPFERNEEYLRLLDKLLLYLRIVHSFDYYNHTEYNFEDDMPNRLGILHVRGTWPADDTQNSYSTNGSLYVKKEAITNYIDDFNAKIKCHRTNGSIHDLTEEQRLIVRDADKEMNSDLETWTYKRKDDSVNYQCKHCNKKFQRNIQYLIQHVERSHPQAQAVFRAEVEFFNNYLLDPLKIDPNPPKVIIEESPVDSNTPLSIDTASPMNMSKEAFNKLEKFVKEPAPRGPSTTDPRAATQVDYEDISFDDAI